ncbi:MAG: SDR family oxidoreductase [Alphaproteobacteria bacterium]|nr:SDR family oxidoreductase [Alphaproteobacteria bacterium]
MKSVVVTGVSTGIGHGAARILVSRGMRVFGSVRKPEDGARLAGELGENFHPLIFDVTDENAVRAAAGEVERRLEGHSLSGLVNNAGIAVPGPLLYLRADEIRHQLDVNVIGQIVVTQAFTPLLSARGADQPGRIVMISSVGGRIATPFMGPYNASKFAIEALSDSLRRELMPLGIDVIVIAPGAVATPIWDKAEALDISRYGNTPYVDALARLKTEAIDSGRKGLSEDALGRAVAKALTAARPKARYVVTPDRLQYLIGANLPKRILDRVIANRLGLRSLRQ